MQVRNCLLFFSLVLTQALNAQVEILGLSFWESPTLQVYELQNHLSQEKSLLANVEPDSMGIFKLQLDLKAISTLQICNDQNCGLFYVQPKTRYLIELPQPAQTNTYTETQSDIELLFYKLDSNDINYQILGFEAWMDNYIADIYQLKDIRSNEFILKVLAFKAETAAVYGNEENPFLRDYIKYSVGLTIDNFSVVGGPSKEDKYNFYLQTDSVDYTQPKLVEYAKLFYKAYDAQLDQVLRQELELAFQTANSYALVACLQKDPSIYNQAWAEFVALQLILEREQTKRIPKTIALKMLLDLAQSGQQVAFKRASTHFYKEKSKLGPGQTLEGKLLTDLNLQLEKNQLVYLHYYIPGNQKCIAELAALKRLATRYNGKVQILTFYPAEQAWTNADNKAFEGAKWQKTALNASAILRSQLNWTGAPTYVLLDSQLKVLYLDALGPLPNARTQTIDLVLQQLLAQ